MSDAMSRATGHLERLLKALRSDATLGVCGAGDGCFAMACDSAGVSGSIEAHEKGTLPRPQVSGISNSESDDAPPLSACDDTKYYREETARLVQQLGDSRVQVASLKAREAEDSIYIRRLEEEVVQLKEMVEQEVGNLTRRQDQVELELRPSLVQELGTSKDVPLDFDDSESLEALTRGNDEVQKLTDELHTVAANDRRESELDLSANVARIERLEAERRESLAQIEVLSAKGALFDEVQGKLEHLERRSIDAENQKAAIEAVLQRATQERESLRGSIQEKNHSLDLMSMDKTYLSKEVESLKEQLKKLQSELEQQHEKLREVKRERTELHNKVLSDKRDSQIEILQIKQQTYEDIQLCCKEANANADDKVRTFHEMREESVRDLRDTKAAYEDLLLKFRELQRSADLKEAETQSTLKATTCELDQLKVVLEETKSALDQSRRENKNWIAKEKMLTEKFSEEKTELENSLLGLKELRATRDQLEVFQREKEKVESVEREKAKSFSAWRSENMQGSKGKFKGSIHENQLLEQNSRIDNEEEAGRISMRSQSIQGDIRKLLRARSSVEQLHSLLREKGMSVSVGRLRSITTSGRRSLRDKKAVYSPRISNLDRLASPTRKEIQMMIEWGDTPPRCHQHRSCSPHYPKAYEELVDAMSMRAPPPFSQASNSALFSSAPGPAAPPAPSCQD